MTVGFARKQRDDIQASVKAGSKNYTDNIQKIEGTVRSIVALMLADSSVNSNLMEHLLLSDPPETPSADVPELPEAVVARQAQFHALAQSIKDLTTTVTGGLTASKNMETLKAISLGEERKEQRQATADIIKTQGTILTGVNAGNKDSQLGEYYSIPPERQSHLSSAIQNGRASHFQALDLI
jgi:hypothetical protein